MRKAFDLRPLDFNDVLGRGFSLYMANFVGYLRWFLIMWLLPMLLLAVLFYFALDPYDWAAGVGREAPSLFEPNRYALYHWILQLGSLTFAFTTGASGVYFMTARVYVGANPSLTQVMRAVYERFSNIAGAGLLHVLALLALTAGCLAPPVLMYDKHSPGPAILLGMLLWTAWIPLMLWYYSTFGLNTAVVMLDDAGAGESFGRSGFLSKRFRMRAAGMTFVLVLVVGAPGIPGILGVPGVLLDTLLADSAHQPLLGVISQLTWDAILLPLFFIPYVVYYFDMRCRKESYDLAVMARNFGIAEGEMQRYRFNPHLGYFPKGWKGDRSRRRKQVRKPLQRPAAVRHASAGMPMAQPWGPQPGMPGGFPGGTPQQWGPPQAPPQQWGPPPGPPQQWGPPQAPPQGPQWQNPQWGPPGQQWQPNPNAPPLPGVRNPGNFPNRGNRGSQ